MRVQILLGALNYPEKVKLMGVYYTVQVAYGIRIERESLSDDVSFYDWVEDNAPPGFTAAHGGDLMSGEGYSVVYALPHNVHTVFNSGYFQTNQFGAKKLDEYVDIELADAMKVEKALKELGVGQAGYFIVSRVG